MHNLVQARAIATRGVIVTFINACVVALIVTAGLSPGSYAMTDEETLRNKADAAVAAGDYSGAVKALEKLLQQLPEDGASHYRAGTLLMDNLANPDAAQSHYRKAAELGFQPLGAAYRLSRIYARSGDNDGALAELEKMAAGGFAQINLLEGQADYQAIKDEARFVAALATIRQSRYPCETDPRHRAFDFWLGDWIVTQNGQYAGKNHIESILGGCTVFEQWESAGGTLGKSFNYYDPGNDRWRQIWIDDSGTFIEFTGKARDGGIYFTAETSSKPGDPVTYHKFEFSRNEDGSVRQFWQTSPAQGGPWTTIWDGRYERVATQK